MMKKSTLILLGAAFVAIASIPRTFAQEEKEIIRKRVIERETRGIPGPMGIPDLSEAQQKQIETLQNALDKEMLSICSDLDVLEAELNKLMVSDNAVQKDIDKKIDEISAIKTRTAKLHAKQKRDIRALLTPDQRLVFDKQALHRPMRHGMRGMREMDRAGRRMMHMHGNPEPGVQIEKEEIIEE